MTGASSAEEQARKSKRKGKQLHWNNIKESNKIEAATNEIKSNQVKTNVGFCGGGKTGGPGEKTSQSRVENQQTQATYDAETGNWTTLVEGARSHYCANPDILKSVHWLLQISPIDTHLASSFVSCQATSRMFLGRYTSVFPLARFEFPMDSEVCQRPWTAKRRTGEAIDRTKL